MTVTKIPAIFVEDKWDTYTHRAEDGTIGTAALEILTQRVEQGFWYDNWPERAWADEAAEIVAAADGDRAWRFLKGRSDDDFEYEQRARDHGLRKAHS